MTQKHKIQLFENKNVRTVWDDELEEWYFSIVDVCGVLTESKDPQAYWRKLKQRLKDEGNETVTNCHALKMRGFSELDDVMHNTLGCLLGWFMVKGSWLRV